jgi:hypothetical protein
MLCCIALYLQSVDHRNAAHLFVRLALTTTTPPPFFFLVTLKLT